LIEYLWSARWALRKNKGTLMGVGGYTESWIFRVESDEFLIPGRPPVKIVKVVFDFEIVSSISGTDGSLHFMQILRENIL
jgi:hypothetical protein